MCRSGKLSIIIMPTPPLKPKKRKRLPREEDDEKEEHYLSNILPHDIMLIIFSKLPIKSLVRFRSIRKSWHKLVLDPVLYTMHSNQSTYCNKSKAKLMFTNHQGHLYSLDYQDSNHAVKINIPVLKSNSIWGSCNGLLLTMSLPHLSRALYLSNPCTGEYKKIPSCYGGYGPIVYGFGYSPAFNDYEIVRISSSVTSRNSVVHVYSLRKNTWRKISDVHCEVFRDEAGILVGNSLHWVMYDTEEYSTETVVVVGYDIGGEDLWVMRLPPNSGKETSRIQPAEYKGRLSLFYCDDSSPGALFELWVARNRADTELWTLTLYIRKPIGVDCFLVCMTNDDMVLMTGKDDYLILYDPQPVCRNRREIKVNLNMENVDQPVAYLESLVRLNY